MIIRTKAKPYCQMWVVLRRPQRSEPYEIHRDGLNNLAGYETKADARHVAKRIRDYVGRGNVYVQRYGPYR